MASASTWRAISTCMPAGTSSEFGHRLRLRQRQRTNSIHPAGAAYRDWVGSAFELTGVLSSAVNNDVQALRAALAVEQAARLEAEAHASGAEAMVAQPRALIVDDRLDQRAEVIGPIQVDRIIWTDTDPPRHRRDIGRGVGLHLRRPAFNDRPRHAQLVAVLVGDQQGGQRPDAELMAAEPAEPPFRRRAGQPLPLVGRDMLDVARVAVAIYQSAWRLRIDPLRDELFFRPSRRGSSGRWSSVSSLDLPEPTSGCTSKGLLSWCATWRP